MGEVELPIREPVGRISQGSRYLSQTTVAKLSSRDKMRFFLEDPSHSKYVNKFVIIFYLIFFI